MATAVNQARLGLPWLDNDQAIPGKSGAQHRWDAMAENAAFGAARPSDTEMLKRIRDGRIQCAACHDVHADVKVRDPNPAHTSIATGVPTAQTSFTVGTMTMTLVPGPAALTKGYRLQVAAAVGNQFELAISHDAGTTVPTWWVHNGAWVQGVAPDSGTTTRTSPSTFILDDAAVQVSFAGTPAIGQFWDFYVSYAHLRASNVNDAMCIQCHASRNQTHTYVGGTGDGIKVFSHPVGVALNANGGGYDRAAVLDANGALQTTGDTNASNDLKLDAGLVRCTTCHNVHNADSNSITVDPR